MIFGRLVGTYATTIKTSSGNQTVPLSGYMEIEPAISHVIVDSETILPTTTTLTLVDGVLTHSGSPGVDLLATDNPNQNPTHWLYRAEGHFTFSGRPVGFKSFYFALPHGATTDLNTLVPVPYPNRLALAVPIGPPGEKGDKGDQGDQGNRGLQGLQGLQGLRGDNANVVIVDDFADVTSPLPPGTLVILTPR